jgi:thiamine-monophosphate kinase
MLNQMMIFMLINKAKFKNKDKLFFVDKYYKPRLPLNFTKYLLKYANSSIDVSDGLIDDLSKMINRQNLSFHLFENKIPISKNLNNLIKKQKLNKINLISNGDDYQVLFTADLNKSRIIQNASKSTGIKITKIGKIVSGKDRSSIIDEKGKQIRAKSKGYIHKF